MCDFLSETIAGNVFLGYEGFGGKEGSVSVFLHDPSRSRQVSERKYRRRGPEAGVKAARPKTPRHLLAVTRSGPGVFVVESDEPELFNVPLPSEAGQRESGGVWRPGRWRPQLVPRPNPSPSLRQLCVLKQGGSFRSESRLKPGSCGNCEASSRLPDVCLVF